MDYTTRSMDLAELHQIYQRIEQDFAPGEYAPYNILRQQLQTGVQKGLILLAEGREVAYSICAEGANGYVLISLLAVYQEFRGRGFGTRFLEQLQQSYADKQGMIVEVEKPEDAATSAERVVREKRIHFYQKTGFDLVPDIDYVIWDVPMHLMALPLKTGRTQINADIGRIIYEIYLGLMGEGFIHKLQCEELGG